MGIYPQDLPGSRQEKKRGEGGLGSRKGHKEEVSKALWRASDVLRVSTEGYARISIDEPAPLRLVA